MKKQKSLLNAKKGEIEIPIKCILLSAEITALVSEDSSFLNKCQLSGMRPIFSKNNQIKRLSTLFCNDLRILSAELAFISNFYLFWI